MAHDVLVSIFMDVLQSSESLMRSVTVLSCVCRRWRLVCQDLLLWDYIAKRHFVVYPLVTRLHRDYALRHSYADKEVGVCPVAASLEAVLPRPSPATVRAAMREVKQHLAQRQYYNCVRRRRSFVLHLFLSLILLSITLSVTSAMCAAEGLSLCRLCTRTASFSFLWTSYILIAAIIVSNVVMQAHFEPQPLLMRLHNNKTLIVASALTIVLGICDIVVPTLLININMTRRQRFSWVWCGLTVILSFVVWQCYALASIMPDAIAHVRRQHSDFDVREAIRFFVFNIPNTFPILFAIAAFCLLQYVQQGHRIYVLLSGVPIIVSLLVLSIVFVLDFIYFQQLKDLSVGLCLLAASFCPLSLLVWDFRGWCLLPLVAASFGFFISHAYFMLRITLRNFVQNERAGRSYTTDSSKQLRVASYSRA